MGNPAASQVLRVSLARKRERAAASPALDPQGARVVLGTQVGDSTDPGLAAPIAPADDTLFGPRGACVAANGSLWIADTGHHRMLGWRCLPTCDGQAADWQIGQPDFTSEGRNARGPVTAASLNVPTGICACGDGLAVADAWNHRVLIWQRTPCVSGQPADIVLGQADFSGNEINRGANVPAADTLYWSYGVYWDGVRLWVADTGNRRVLRWDRLPTENGQPANHVLGQIDFVHRDENAGRVNAASLRWPHAITHWQGRLCVADAGDNRVLGWSDPTPRNQPPSDLLLGQADIEGVDHNRGEYWPTAASFNMPYGIATHRDRLLVADTANSRILRFDNPGNEHAGAVAGQPGFTDKGDNRWQPATRDSLCWPYALNVHEDLCLVADSGNNRVLLWEIAP